MSTSPLTIDAREKRKDLQLVNTAITLFFVACVAYGAHAAAHYYDAPKFVNDYAAPVLGAEVALLVAYLCSSAFFNAGRQAVHDIA